MASHEAAANVNDVESLVNAWYDACRPRFIDLVGDYAGKELFLLEGESLLRLCFSDDRIDFHDGFQMLHAVFVVERFLEGLIKRYCQFHIAFFDDHSKLCIPHAVSINRRSRYLLARSVIIRHLQLHLSRSSNVKIHIFPSRRGHEFSQYLAISPIHFVMAHDGALLASGKKEKETITDVRAKVLLRGCIWWYHRHGLNVALINRVEFRDSKVGLPVMCLSLLPIAIHPGLRVQFSQFWMNVSLSCFCTRQRSPRDRRLINFGNLGLHYDP